MEHASYRQVCGGSTGHAEVVLVEFDPSVVSYSDLVRVFFKLHTPTDSYGSQYRSAIFSFGAGQEASARRVLEEVAPRYSRPIVTQIAEAGAFWKAEDYHQRYYEKKGWAPEAAVCAAPER